MEVIAQQLDEIVDEAERDRLIGHELLVRRTSNFPAQLREQPGARKFPIPQDRIGRNL